MEMKVRTNERKQSAQFVTDIPSSTQKQLPAKELFMQTVNEIIRNDKFDQSLEVRLNQQTNWQTPMTSQLITTNQFQNQNKFDRFQ
jgi:hypothetical protein